MVRYNVPKKKIILSLAVLNLVPLKMMNRLLRKN